MTPESISASRYDFLTHHAPLAQSLYVEAKGPLWGLSRECFAEALRRSADKRFRTAAGGASEVESYLKSLHLEDLALACACSQGIEAAWEFFVLHFQKDLHQASRAILRSSGKNSDADAEDLADSLLAELYGLRSAAGERRKSLFEYFHGRSKLSTWLRAVLAQRHVDLLRASRETLPLDTDADETPCALPQHALAAPADPHRAKYLALIDRALSVALAGLTPRERMLLSCYYVDQSTLAEIGRALGEHESTVSRQLDRIRRGLREAVTHTLRSGMPGRNGDAGERGLDDSQVEVAFEYAVEDWPFDLSQALSQAGAASNAPKNSRKD